MAYVMTFYLDFSLINVYIGFIQKALMKCVYLGKQAKYQSYDEVLNYSNVVNKISRVSSCHKYITLDYSVRDECNDNNFV